MYTACQRIMISLVAWTLAACSDRVREPVTPVPASPVRNLELTTEVWHMADVEADLAGLYSLDTTQAGANATPYIAMDVAGEDFCRDHFKPIDMYWDGGYGNMRFHLSPPLLFVGYRRGTYRTPKGLVFRRAVYETISESRTQDPAGNTWRFQGRFNTLCRGGQLELGPVVFGGQLLVAQDPLTTPSLVRRGSGGDGCGGWKDEPIYMTSYDPYAPHGEEDGIAADCDADGSTGGSSGGFSTTCRWDHVTLEVSYDGGATWQTYWSGWAQVCDTNET
jgi:hypothetical protein